MPVKGDGVMNIKNLRIQYFAYSLLTTGFVIIANKFMGNDYPFVLDKEKYDYIEETYTNISTREEIKEGEIPQKNELYLYSEWRRNYKTNKYERYVDKYLLDDEKKENILDLVDFGNLDTRDVLGAPEVTYIETKKELDEFEHSINTEGYKYIYYNDDNSKVVYENKTRNLVVTLMELAEIIAANIFIYDDYRNRKVKKL